MRLDPSVLWVPPLWTRHLAALMMLLAFICIAAAYIPGNIIKGQVRASHAGGRQDLGTCAPDHQRHARRCHSVRQLPDLGQSLQFRTSRRRDKANGTIHAHLSMTRDILVFIFGIAGVAVFSLFLHQWLIGVRPF